MHEPLILASASPRRRELFRLLGHPFEAVTSEFDEETVAETHPARYVVALARGKAEAVSGCAGTIVAADTTVVLDGEFLNKPGSPDEAVAMLRRLSGRAHTVFTGLFVGQSDGSRWQREPLVGAVATEVVFRPLSDRLIDRYVATGEPMDKAGAYGIQHYGALLVAEVRGDYFNVVGLPLVRLSELLEACGFDVPGPLAR